MATPQFTSSESDLGIITPGTMQRFSAATYGVGRQMVAEMGGDVSDPRQITKALQSRTAADRLKSATDARSKQDSRILNRVMGASVPTFGGKPLGSGTLDENLMAGAQESSMALQRNIVGRAAAGRQIQAENDKLANLAGMDTAIDAREKKLKDKVLQGIERNIMDVKNKALAGRSILRSQLGHLSPAQRNAVLAAQSSMFTNQINNLEDLRSAREGAIDARVADDRASLDSQIKSSEQRVKGLEAAVKAMEASNADASAIADIRVKLAQEREKLRKKGGGTVTRKDIVVNAMIKNFRKTHDNRSPSPQELQDINRQAELATNDPSLEPAIDDTVTPPGQIPNGPSSVMGSLAGARLTTPDLGQSLEIGGYGIPVSREEQASGFLNDRKVLEGELGEPGKNMSFAQLQERAAALRGR